MSFLTIKSEIYLKPTGVSYNFKFNFLQILSISVVPTIVFTIPPRHFLFFVKCKISNPKIFCGLIKFPFGSIAATLSASPSKTRPRSNLSFFILVIILSKFSATGSGLAPSKKGLILLRIRTDETLVDSKILLIKPLPLPYITSVRTLSLLRLILLRLM